MVLSFYRVLALGKVPHAGAEGEITSKYPEAKNPIAINTHHTTTYKYRYLNNSPTNITPSCITPSVSERLMHKPLNFCFWNTLTRGWVFLLTKKGKKIENSNFSTLLIKSPFNNNTLNLFFFLLNTIWDWVVRCYDKNWGKEVNQDKFRN